MSTDESRFPDRLRAARELRELSQGDLAGRTGLQPSAVSHFETGRRSPSFANLKRLADALHVTTDYLLGRSEAPQVAGAVADQMFRDAHRLSAQDLEAAAAMIETLAKKRKAREEDSWGLNAKLRRQAAAHQAEEVIERFGVAALPVDPFAIAHAEDIEVQAKAASEGVSGFLLKLGDDFGICYATHIKNEGFIRFSIAHELGHYFLDGHPEHLFGMGDGAHQSRSGFTSGDPYEMEADEFAANLLMPKGLFGRAMRESGRGFEAIQRLAELCKTSITSTAIRYAMRADEYVAVIVSSGIRIDYCFMSDRLKSLSKIEWLRRGQGLPAASQTAKFNRDAENVARGECLETTAMLDEWMEGAPEVEVCEDIVGLGSYGRTLTVLHADDDLDLDEAEG